MIDHTNFMEVIDRAIMNGETDDTAKSQKKSKRTPPKKDKDDG